MGSILDENPGGAGPFSGGKLSTAQKKSRRARKERLERAMAIRETWDEADFEREREELERQKAAILEARNAA